MDNLMESRPFTGTPPSYTSSDYLAEKLQQRRARVTKPRRARHTDIGPLMRSGLDDDIFLNEAEEQSRDERARLANSVNGMLGAEVLSSSRSSAGHARRSTLGVRSMEERMDRLTKDNFALKMEVDQRRQYTTKLQEQIDNMSERLERFDRVQEEVAELWRINDTLVKELEKRHRAVEEAIDTICELEDKVAELEERRSTSSTTRPSTAHADSGYAGTEFNETSLKVSPGKPSQPPKTPRLDRANTTAASMAGGRLQHVANLQTPAPKRREPNVLSLKKPSTQALRSVYLDNSQSLNGVKSFISLLKERESTVEEDEAEFPLSPCLSVLSEGSLASVSSPRQAHLTPERLALEASKYEPRLSPYSSIHIASINRVSQWINEGHPSPQSPILARKVSASSEHTERDPITSSPSKRPGDEARYRSIADALTTTTGMPPAENVSTPVPYSEPAKMRSGRANLPRRPRPTSIAGPIFSDPAFPPLSDHVTTRVLRGSRSTVAEDGNRNVNQFVSSEPIQHAALPDRTTRNAPKQMRSSVELNSAYVSHLQRQSSEQAIADDDDIDPAIIDHTRPSHDDDAYSETVHDLSLEYDGFPDGNSILFGTPSRFLRHGKPPGVFSPTSVSPNLAADGIEPIGSPRRPQSSTGFHPMPLGRTPRKPSFSRADTSPSFVGTTMVGVGKLLRRMSGSSSRRRLR